MNRTIPALTEPVAVLEQVGADHNSYQAIATYLTDITECVKVFADGLSLAAEHTSAIVYENNQSNEPTEHIATLIDGLRVSAHV